jgi:hypothetical protein
MANKIISPVALFSAVALLSGTLHAQTTFSDEQDFLDGLLPSYYNEDFSAFDDSDNNTGNFALTFDDDGAAAFSFTATTVSDDGSTSPSGVVWFTQGDNYQGTGLSVAPPEDEPPDRLLITGFTGGVDAIGASFFLTDDAFDPIDWVDGTLTVTVWFDDNTFVQETLTSSVASGEFEFFGVYAAEGQAITSMEVVSTTANAFPTVGSITVGSEIPEPATVVLWAGLGVFALVVALRRRKRSA